MFWLSMLCVFLTIIIVVLSCKIFLMRKASKEISTEFSYRIRNDTNTLISISSHDSSMRELANSINQELRTLRNERHRFQMGDWELKQAVTNISHDLRTPLTAICGYLDLIENETDSQKKESYLDIVKGRVNVLCELTEELFRYSIFMSSSYYEHSQKECLNDILEESISAYYAALKSCHIKPQIFISNKRIYVSLNKQALLRVLANIMGNAVKYSDGDLCIQLLDNGEMIFTNHASQLDEVLVGKLFDRFYTVTTAKKSTGLGLAIAKGLTEQMNGKITAYYKEGSLSIHLLFPII